MALAIGGCALWFSHWGALPDLWNVLHHYPARAAAEVHGPAGLDRLWGPLRWFVAAFAGWILLASLCVRCLRRLWTDVLAVLMVVWIVGGGAILYFDPRSLWPFHLLLFVVPIGVLAAYGVDGMLGALPGTKVLRGRAVGTPVLVLGGLALLIGMATWFDHAVALGRHVAKSGVTDLDRYRLAAEPNYEFADRALAAVDGEDLAGGLYVFGSTVIQLRAQRPPAFRLHGWAWEALLDEHWRELAADLAASPGVAVYMDDEHRDLAAERYPVLLEYLNRHRTAQRVVGLGTWFLPE